MPQTKTLPVEERRLPGKPKVRQREASAPRRRLLSHRADGAGAMTISAAADGPTEAISSRRCCWPKGAGDRHEAEDQRGRAGQHGCAGDRSLRYETLKAGQVADRRREVDLGGRRRGRLAEEASSRGRPVRARAEARVQDDRLVTASVRRVTCSARTCAWSYRSRSATPAAECSSSTSSRRGTSA